LSRNQNQGTAVQNQERRYCRPERSRPPSPPRRTVAGHVFQLFNHIRGSLNIALRLIGIEVKFLADFRLSVMQGVDDIEHGNESDQHPEQYRQRSEQVA
jgi:hypothetical protein